MSIRSDILHKSIFVFAIRQALPHTLLSLAFVLVMMTTAARADILYLNPKGVEALSGKGIAQPHPDGRRYFIRGQIIVPRDDADRPTLKSPGTYFMFRPLGKGASQQLEWAWVLETRHQIDTLDDLRAIFSNRDKQFGSWAAAFNVLIAEADPNGTLGFKALMDGNPARAANRSNAQREGWFSQFLLRGPMLSSERTALVRAAKDKGPIDPLGYSPIDPLWQQQTPQSTMTMLIEAIARSEKHGEAEPGLLDACRAAARFLCETSYVPIEAETGPDGERAREIRTFVLGARATLLGYVESASADSLRIRLRRAAANASADALRHTLTEDELRLDVFNIARAAMNLLGALSTTRDEDKTRVVEALLSVADAVAIGSAAASLPPAISGEVQALAPRAMATLLALASASSGIPPERNSGFRIEMVTQLSRANSESQATTIADAILKSGVGSFREIATLIKGLFNIGLAAAATDRDPRLRAATQILKQLPKSPMSEDLRAALQKAINKEILELERRQENGSGGQQERRFLDLLQSNR